VSRLVTLHHRLQLFAVVDVAGGDTDKDGQAVRVRQGVRIGTRFAPVRRVRACVFTPLFLALTWAVQHGLMQTASDTCSGPDAEPPVGGRFRDAEARRQRAPSAPGHQDVDDRGEQCLIGCVLRSAALRSHLRGRDQRLRDLPWPIRNNPTPRTPPHTGATTASLRRTCSKAPALGSPAPGPRSGRYLPVRSGTVGGRAVRAGGHRSSVTVPVPVPVRISRRRTGDRSRRPLRVWGRLPR
jgi:hypothetical protein